MSRVDWTAIEAQLNETRATTAQELEDIDAVLETVRARGASTPAPKSKAAPAHKNGRAKAKPTNGKAPRQDKITPDQLATMRTQFEAGVKVAEICKRVGVSDATVYTRAKAGQWKRPGKAKAARPKSGAAALPAAAAPKLAVVEETTKLSGNVKCTSCDLWTETDPCKHCGKKLRRNW